MDSVLDILLGALGVIVTGLASLVVAKFTQWINEKISDKKAANYLATIAELTMVAVCEIQQTYVESLKKDGSFDADAQKNALDMCLTKIKVKLAPEIVAYVTENYGDLDDYLKGLIESTIYKYIK